MRGVRLFALVLANLRRSRNHFLLASIGIVVGIATFAFFLSLGLGVRKVVLGKIFPLDKIEVVPKSLDVDVGPLRMGLGRDVLDDAMVAKLEAIPGVKTVYPKMKLTVGSIAYGGEALFGSDLRSEIVADGIDPALMAEEINKNGYEFVDFDAPERRSAEPLVPCTKDEECGEHEYCGVPPGETVERKKKTSRARPKPRPQPRGTQPLKTPAKPGGATGATPSPTPSPTKTAPGGAAGAKPTSPKTTPTPKTKPAGAGAIPTRIAPEAARRPTPSQPTPDSTKPTPRPPARATPPAGAAGATPPAGATAPATPRPTPRPATTATPPKTTPAAKEQEAEPAKVCRHFVPVIVSNHVVELYNGTLRRAHGFPKLNPDAVRGFTFDLIVGESMVAASNQDRVVHDRGMFVGFSDKAIPLGITLPLGYVQRYNVEFGNEEDAQRYHSVIVEVPTKDDVARVAKGVEDLDLEVKDSGAEEAALLIAVFMLVFGLVSAVIVGIAAVNIMHVFFMLVYERQGEIGVMRAVGASRGDIGRIILGEAASLGLMAGTAGLVLAVTATRIFDQVSARYVPDFPYKPTTYFDFPWWLVLAALAFSVSFCVLGAALPARRAARMEPARVLSGN